MDNDFGAVILSACRTPIGSFGGVFRDLSAVDLATIVVREAIARAHVQVTDVGDVVLGCVLQAGAGMNVARQAALRAGLPVDVPAETVNRVCGSGLQAVVHATEAIHMGYVDTVVAGGTESMSNAPYLLAGARWGAPHQHRRGDAVEGGAQRPVATEQRERGAEPAHLSRLRPHARVERLDVVAREVGVVGELRRVDTDEYPRAGTTVEKLAELKAAFNRKQGSVTAGNASGINDGAAALVVTSRAKASAMGAAPLARIVSHAVIGVDPAIMGMGPVPAVRKALERARLRTGDVDLFELNEAFAVQSLAVVRELGLDAAKVNVNGGAVALGHPIGASGARILTTLIYALRARKLRHGVASLCIGGGMGIAMVVEAL